MHGLAMAMAKPSVRCSGAAMRALAKQRHSTARLWHGRAARCVAGTGTVKAMLCKAQQWQRLARHGTAKAMHCIARQRHSSATQCRGRAERCKAKHRQGATRQIRSSTPFRETRQDQAQATRGDTPGRTGGVMTSSSQRLHGKATLRTAQAKRRTVSQCTGTPL